MHKLINWEFVMHFWVNVFYLFNVAAGAIVIELAARGMRWIGVSDFLYYVMSGIAHLLLIGDGVLLLLLVYVAARDLFRKVINAKQSKR
jgi:hypothetical protein